MTLYEQEPWLNTLNAPEGELADGPERVSEGTALVPAAPDVVAAG